MKPPPFAYARPSSIDEALELLADPEARVLAGGQSLVPLLALRLASPSLLVDLAGIPGLDRIDRLDDGSIRIGARVTHSAALADPTIGDEQPLLAAALALIGHRAIRNRGTIAGSLAHADPAAELPAVAVATRAELHVVGPQGERTVAAADWFRSYLTTDLRPGELLVAVRFPAVAPRSGSSFEEVSRRSGDFALAGVAASVELAADGTVADVSLALAGVAGVPLRASSAELELLGRRPGAEQVERAAQAAAEGLRPPSDLHATAAHRRRLIEVLVRRALIAATQRAAAVRSGPSAGRPPPSPSRVDEPMSCPTGGRRPLRLRINGVDHETVVEARQTLAEVLRDELGLTGTHVGCEHGVCGACTVLVDGHSVRSCLLLAVQLERHSVTTVEGLGSPTALHPLQQGCWDAHAFQCGFCTPGMLLSALELLDERAEPSDGEIRDALSGNLCRCTGYESIVAGVRRGAELLRAGRETG